MRERTRRALILFVVLTVGILLSFIIVWKSPAVSLDDVYELGPGTFEPSLIVSVFFLWCLAGTVLWWARGRNVTSDTLVLLVGAAVISLVYLTFLREHVWFGDYRTYIRAAKAMLAGSPLPERYLYPPLWAFLISLIQRAAGGGTTGDGAAILFCFVMNHLSIVGFFVLGSLFLSKCGLSRTLSSLLLFAAMVVNVPVLRNMVYVQVNLLIVDLVLAGVLVFRRSTLLSAFLFALATHVKVIPVTLLPVFLYRKEYRWLIYYGLLCAGIAWVTTLPGGWGHYRAFIENLWSWHPAPLRSSTIYGFLLRTNMLFGSRLPVRGLFNVARAALVLWLYTLSYLSLRRDVFAGISHERSRGLINGIVPLMFILPVVSPTVWVHHFVVLVIPAILALTHMRGIRRLGLWVTGYFFTFILPAFDFYPWSYLRLVGWLALLVALSDVVLSAPTTRWVVALDRVVCRAFEGVTNEVAAILSRARSD